MLESPRNSMIVELLLAVKSSVSVIHELLVVGIKVKSCEASGEVPVALAVMAAGFVELS